MTLIGYGMPRRKRQAIKRLPPIDLMTETDAQQKAVWDYYQLLTATGEAAEWIRRALIAALPAQSKVTRHPKLITSDGVPYIEPSYEKPEDIA